MEEQSSKPKLPILVIVRDAVLIPINAWRTLFVAIAATGLAMILLQISASMGLMGEGFIISLLNIAAEAVIFILFAITCHRSILLGADATPKYGLFEWNWREWRYVGWATVAYFYLYALMALAGMIVGLITQLLAECDSSIYCSALFVLAFLQRHTCLAKRLVCLCKIKFGFSCSRS